MYFQLKKDAYKWNSKLEKVENSGTEMTNRDDFWELISLRKFLDYELSANSMEKSLISNAIVKDLMKEPKLIFDLPLFCTWFLREFDKLPPEDFDAVAKLKTTTDWLPLLLPQAKGSQCELAVAKNLLAFSFKYPSEAKDKLILLPYLEKQGVANSPEDWLSYAQRLEQSVGAKDPNVVDIYKNLEKNSKDSLIKSTAALWLKKNFPEAADKVLW